MDSRELAPQGEQALEQVLGYLNFSAGAPDPNFLANLNTVFGLLAGDDSLIPLWRRAVERLREKLRERAGTSPTFSDTSQAEGVLTLLIDCVLPEYRQFHRDLLFHQTEETLFNSFFVGRACEVILRQGGPWDETDRIVRRAITQLNDFLGHRPVAALESRKIEPYPHEWLRPIPLYVRGAGVAVGPYRPVIDMALKLLQETDEDLLRQAHFDPQLLDELALDPRAYDFDHPVNKRPNYHFGQWDPHQIDNQGRYRRYVIQQVTLDALMKRVTEPVDLPRVEAVFEAAAVLAGTIIMASGVGGRGPDAHDSTVTLSNLLPLIARYRDLFYQRLLARANDERSERLQLEAKERQQPFGGARQHLNAELARRRAAQLEHVHLAQIFARMGYPEAAARQANVVPTASARMRCQIDCWLTEGAQSLEIGEVAHAATLLPQIVDTLHRGIECGAIIDPWNILGFDAHYSLFPALENSVHDHRADELCALLEQIFGLYAHVWSEAAARNDQTLCRQVSREFQETAKWWHRFATHEVSSVEAVDAHDTYRAAERVAKALNLWHKGNAAAGDVAFWAPHAEVFDSPQAYALVVESLLKKNDYVASMALLVHWVGQAERIPLESGEASFHRLAEQWITQLLTTSPTATAQAAPVVDGAAPETKQRRSTTNGRSPAQLAQKFFDYLEANAETYWNTPEFSLTDGSTRERRRAANDEEENDGSKEVFDAAYEDVVYRDSTDDGVDGAIFETDDTTQDELTQESRRLASRLAFHSTLARMWRIAVTSPSFVMSEQIPAGTMVADAPTTDSAIRHREIAATWKRWSEQAEINHKGLLNLLDDVRSYRIPTPATHHDAMLEFDQKRMLRDALLDQVVNATVEVADARRLLLTAALAVESNANSTDVPPAQSTDDDEQTLATLVRSALLRGDVVAVRRHWPRLLKAFSDQRLLYVSLAKGGRPHDMLAARIRQRTIQDLLAALPRLGLLHEACQLLETAREMERTHPVGPGAVTEFDDLFKTGIKSIVDSLIASSATWKNESLRRQKNRPANPQSALVEALEQLTEAVLMIWLNHSRTLRLSVLEKVHDKSSWKRLVEFIERYGADLFTQRFLNVGNIRSILHQGVEPWLEQLREDDEPGEPLRIVAELDGALSRGDAVEHLTLILDAVYENYGEYRDYNSTTTQSDRGELLYTLLDFLRLRSKYDRIAWNLKPVVWVHEILVRRNQDAAAKAWRRALAERIGEEADQYQAKLAELQKKYAMRMPTVADRLSERFVRSMTIDRIRALVAPAMHNAGSAAAKRVFELLEHETESLTRQPSGAGLDVPAWLVALEEEVDRVRHPLLHPQEPFESQTLVPFRPLTTAEVRDQLATLHNRSDD